MVLGKFQVPGRPFNLDYSWARAYCACSRCGGDCFDCFSLFFLPLSGRRPGIDGNIVSKGRLAQTTNQMYALK